MGWGGTGLKGIFTQAVDAVIPHYTSGMEDNPRGVDGNLRHSEALAKKIG